MAYNYCSSLRYYPGATSNDNAARYGILPLCQMSVTRLYGQQLIVTILGPARAPPHGCTQGCLSSFDADSARKSYWFALGARLDGKDAG